MRHPLETAFSIIMQAAQATSLSVDAYQKLSDIEHVLKRYDMYTFFLIIQ